MIYDRINKFGGAERILIALHELFPEAPIYTSVLDKNNATWANIFPEIYCSFLQKFPVLRSNHEFIPYLMPLAFEQFDFSAYDLIISVSSEAAKGVVTKPCTRHICIALTPTRYLWSGFHDLKMNLQGNRLYSLISGILSIESVSLRKWDFFASRRPDDYISISKNVADRISKYYQRKSELIYPPVNTDFFTPDNSVQKQDYFLTVSRLVSYKKINIAIEACNTLKAELVVIGKGRELNNLRNIAGNTVTFITDNITDDLLKDYYRKAKAVIFPSNEDFGIVPLESQSCGTPVIAFRAGGALETIKEGITGEFFPEQNAESLKQAILYFSKKHYNREDCVKNAKKFDKQVFIKKIQKHINIELN